MSLLVWDHWSAEWELNEKVSFNGFEKIITVNSDITNLDIMEDVYSAWVRWTSREPRFLAAMKYSGFDPIPSGRTGATFFLINGWKLIINLRQTRVFGVLYSSDYPTAYYDNETFQPLYPAEVSSVVNTVYAQGGGVAPTVTQIRQEIDNNSAKLSSIVSSQTTINANVLNIASDVRTELAPELAHIMALENQTSGLTLTQANMLLEMYNLLGLDPSKPLIVSKTGSYSGSRVAGDIQQSITGDATQTILTRVQQ